MADVTYQLVLSALQTIALVVGVAFYVTISGKKLRLQEAELETRRAQTLMRLYNESYNNDSFIDAYVRLADFNIHSYEEYLKLNEDEANKKAFTKVAMFFEGVGVLVREGHISIGLFAQLMTGMTKSWWERLYKSYLEEGREKRGFKRWMSESEYLYDELMKYHQTHPELSS